MAAPTNAPFGSSDPLAGLYQLMQSGAGTGVQLPDQGTAQNQLAILKQFDPNASIVTTPGAEYSNETGQGTRPDTYSINFDQSKLPSLSAGAASLGPNAVNFDPNSNTFNSSSASGGHEWLKDPSKKYFDPTYGWLTSAGNLGSEYTGDGSFGDTFANKYAGPIVMGLATGGMGAGIGAALGSTLAGSIAGSALNQGLNIAQGGKFSPIGLLASAAGGAAGGFAGNAVGGGVLGDLASGLTKYGVGTMINGQKPSAPGVEGIVGSALAKNFNPISFLNGSGP